MSKIFKKTKKADSSDLRRRVNEQSNRKFYTYSSTERARVGTSSSANSSSVPRRDAPPLGSSRSYKNETKTKRTFSLERLSLMAILLLVIGCLVYISTLSPKARVVVQSSKKSKLLHSKEEYQQALEDIFSSSLLNRSKLTVDNNKVSQEMVNRFPEIEDVQVILPLAGRRPTVELKTDQVKLVVVSGDEVYGVGASGKVLIKIKDKPEVAKGLPKVIDKANLSSKLGQSILTSQDVEYILNVIDQFEANDIAIESITLPNVAAEMHVKPKAVNYIIKFSFLTDYKVGVGQYLALRKKITAENIVPTAYIDSRVEERIYYK